MPSSVDTAAASSDEDLGRLAIELGGMGSWDWDLRTGRVTGSRQMEELLGLVAGGFDGEPDSFWRLVLADDVAPLRASLAASRDRRTRFRAEFRVARPGGEIVWLMAHGDFLRDPAGEPVRMLGVVKDITERKRREQQLAHVQQLETVRLLAGGVAHDFNNMLASILGWAGHARTELAGGGDAGACLDEIEHAATRAGELCRQLLTFAGRGGTEPAVLDPEALVRDIARLLAVVIAPGTTLTIDAAPDVPPVRGDAVQLRQVLMNLVVNASEALGGDGGEVAVRISRAAVPAPTALSAWASPACAPGEYVVIEVRDTGEGIAPETLPRLFDPFFTTKPAGRGLGLATVLGILDRHAGFVSVDSVPQRGTTFRVHLPAHRG